MTFFIAGNISTNIIRTCNTTTSMMLCTSFFILRKTVMKWFLTCILCFIKIPTFLIASLRIKSNWWIACIITGGTIVRVYNKPRFKGFSKSSFLSLWCTISLSAKKQVFYFLQSLISCFTLVGLYVTILPIFTSTNSAIIFFSALFFFHFLHFLLLYLSCMIFVFVPFDKKIIIMLLRWFMYTSRVKFY